MLTSEIECPVAPEVISEKSFPDDRQDSKRSVAVIETSSPDSDSTTDSRTSRQKYISLLQFVALCWPLTLNGWNDGTTGALLPRIQTVYEVKYIIVSLIFVSACVGFMTGSVLNLYVTPRLGFGKTLFLGSILQTAAYCIQAAAPPYPAFVLGYYICGIGISLQDAQANGFVGNLKYDAVSKMGLLHSAYGLGLLIAPFVSTQFAQLPRWSFHFLVSLGLSLSNVALQLAVFRLRSLDDCLGAGGEPHVAPAPVGKGGLFRQVMKSYSTHIIAIFIIVHLGTCVTLSGWIVTYIIDVRGGGPSAGYISAGVFGGFVLGRFALIKVNQKIGERYAIILYSMCCVVLEIIVWRVPSLVGSAVAACFVGFFLGPMYPIAANQAVRVLPPYLLTGSLGWIAGFGQTGSALLPFMTGVIANKTGLGVMPPILMGLTILMALLWTIVPNTPYTT
ncbi:hypothetical protein HYPSUDRAFT_140706 [Hypholoma sublateritium FD-334 SS-4]|uniref:Major facilitator superfamily (MFS) profile domain-containing protein n=1 Tax=Hypholoma sublateritium (strain FD-334 SS-4) TaxID=945553 RepID=A0A0D2NY68_HYPSF|nr:hypothetical protein HYPSUDRAFT_140706 [Hypholoma sublateritium FD-334 SS-4]